MLKVIPTLQILAGIALVSALQLVQATDKPNVVFILIDDISHYGVSAYGATELNATQVDGNGDPFFETITNSTPQIDRLANEGLLVNNAFAYAICEPTRIALMTAMNNHRNFIKPKALHESQITFGDIFKKAGYTTGIAGKWKQSRGTAEVAGENYVETFGWDEVHCFDLLYEGARHISPNFVINGQITWFNQNLNNGIDPLTGRRYYGPELVNRFALDFIENNQEGPFFLYYPMLLVHDEHTPTPDTTPQADYDNFEVMTNTNVANETGYGAFKGDDRRYYPDMVAFMDKMIGNVTDKLDALGLREETLIIVMGDNGTKQAFSYTLPDGSVFVGGKGETRSNGTQVPLILSQPGTITAQSTYDGLVNLTDILPTLCEATGLEVPNADSIDGLSFWQQASGASTDAHRQHAYTWYNKNRPMTDQSSLIIYAQEVGYKRYAPDSNFPQGRFFDLSADPQEITDAYNNTVDIGLGILHRSGLDTSTLTADQQAAYDRLGTVISENAVVPVTDLGISARFEAKRYSTNFEGSEGFINGAINKSALFHEVTAGGMYLPAGMAPVYGKLAKSPTAGGGNVINSVGTGASFGPGATWTTEIEFTFEGLENTAPGNPQPLITGLGFCTSPTAVTNSIYVGLQKNANMTENYHLFIFQSGGSGYINTGLPYSAIGDDTADADDLTDKLKLSLTLTKSSTPNEFDVTATLLNLDTGATVKTFSHTITHSTAYSSDLYGFFKNGTVKEANNFDLLQMYAFDYLALPETSDQSMATGKIRVGQAFQLNASYVPSNGTMRNVVWKSNNPEVVSVDKFGVATALKTGEATLSIYSWEDARPLSAGGNSTLDTSGINKQITLQVQPRLVIMDADNDGIEDTWETAYFTDLSSADASSDSDQDGISDLVEFWAGTNPNDAGSNFQLTPGALSSSSNEFAISWPSATGRNYSIMKSNDMSTGWSVLQSGIASTPPINNFNVDSSDAKAFYSIQIDESAE